MTAEQIRVVLKTYENILHIFEAKAADYDKLKPTEIEALRHARHMCDRINEFIDAGKIKKATRWLGFMQGVLWVLGTYSINSMRKHNQ